MAGVSAWLVLPAWARSWTLLGGVDTNALDGHSRRPGRARDGCARSRSRRIAPPAALERSVVEQTLPGLSNHCQETSQKRASSCPTAARVRLELAKRRGR